MVSPLSGHARQHRFVHSSELRDEICPSIFYSPSSHRIKGILRHLDVAAHNVQFPDFLFFFSSVAEKIKLLDAASIAVDGLGQTIMRIGQVVNGRKVWCQRLWSDRVDCSAIRFKMAEDPGLNDKTDKGGAVADRWSFVIHENTHIKEQRRTPEGRPGFTSFTMTVP